LSGETTACVLIDEAFIHSVVCSYLRRSYP
jgi:hypothetical protein